MSDQSTITTFRRCFSVGRFRCELTAQLLAGKPIATQVEWSPSYPKRLHPVLLKEYRQKRNRAYAALAEQLGGLAVITDCEGATPLYPDGRIEAVGEPQPVGKPKPTVKTYSLDTGRRVFTARFEEYPDKVVLDFRPSEYGDFGDMGQLAQWLQLLLDVYDGDGRHVEMCHPLTGETMRAFDGGIAVVMPPKGSRS